jgi:hypothetical protein
MNQSFDIGTKSQGGLQAQYDTHEKRFKDAIAFKQSHFTLGNHPPTQISENKLRYRNYSKEMQKLKPTVSTYGLQSSHFDVGDPKKEYAYFSTSYARENDRNRIMSAARTK